jgi:hypothetical protein
LPSPSTFPNSAVREVSAWGLEEAWPGLPRDILPAYVGSGRLGLGLDASGAQILDCEVAKTPAYGHPPNSHQDDIYIFHEAMISDHIAPVNLMPLGYLSWGLEVDGEAVDLVNDPGTVLNWSRKVDLSSAGVTTRLDLQGGISLTLTVFCPWDTGEIVTDVSLRKTGGGAADVVFAYGVNLRLRARSGGGPILDRVLRSGRSAHRAFLVGEVLANGPHRPLEDYGLAYTVASDSGDAEVSQDRIGWRINGRVGPAPLHATVMFRLDSSVYPDAAAFAPAPTSLERLGGAEVWNRHEKDWQHYYASGGDLQTGDTVRDFLFHNSLYLFRTGSTFRYGLPLQFHLFHPVNWHGSTFWDLNFVVDGLLRCGHTEPVARVLRRLDRVKAESGRPFHWLTLYDGSSGMPREWTDTGIHVNAAHAMSAIRFYEHTGNDAYLRSLCYPLVRSVAVYALQDRFTRHEDGSWRGGGAGLDINSGMQPNEFFSTLWFAVVIRKAADYADRLGVDTELCEQWRRILDGLQLPRGEDGYWFSDQHHAPAQWVSMALYPTEGTPLIDTDLFSLNRERQCFIDDYGLQQPWVYFWQALSDLRLGSDRAEAAEANLRRGLQFVYGPGYLSEIVPEGKGGLEGMPPYISAHGAYLTASVEQVLAGSVWDNRIRLFANAPPAMRSAQIVFRDLVTPQGVVVTASLDRDRVQAEFRGDGLQDLELGVPPAWSGREVGVVAGETRTRRVVPENAILQLPLDLRNGAASVTVAPTP